MKKPIIGIMMRSDTDSNNRPFHYVFDRVRSSIINFGGEPLLLSPVKDLDYFPTKWKDFPDFNSDDLESINFWLNLCDGLFLPGGYKFSKYDLLVLEFAIKKDIPILGVCLGMQIMSSLNKDNNLARIESSINHSQSEEDLFCHEVTIDEDSLLYKIIGKKTFMVNSFHRMCCFENPLYKTVGYAPDGVIEAIEMPNKDFVIGVQWHPEKNYDEDENSYKLMSAFIDTSKKYKNNKKAKMVKL